MFGTVVRRMTAASALACMVTMGSVAASAGPVRAQDEWGTITFRLAIRGEVDPADAFWLVLQPTSGEVPMRGGGFFTGGNEFFCLPDEPIGFPHGSRPACAAGDYDISYEVPVGTQLEYSFERFDDQSVRRPDGHLPEPMPILAGTVTADDVTQVRFIVYDYSLGEQPLPDTAVQPAPMPASAVVGIALIGLVAG